MNRWTARLASEFGEGQALADELRYGQIEATSIIKVFAIVESEHLLIKVNGKDETAPR